MFRIARSFQTSAFRRIAAGDSVPSVLVQNGAPSETLNLAKQTANGKFLIVGVPGAFSPGCSQRHIPEYLKSVEKLKNKGIERIFVVTVNDSFVTSAWKQSLLDFAGTPKAESFVDVLADANGEFSKSFDTLFDASQFFGNHRSKRYAALIENGKVSKAFVEKDATGIADSEAAKVLEQI